MFAALLHTRRRPSHYDCAHQEDPESGEHLAAGTAQRHRDGLDRGVIEKDPSGRSPTRDEQRYGFAPAGVAFTNSGVVETAAGRKPRAIIQTASTISCTPRGSCSKFCAEELPPMTPYIASR